jgi:hypothetical protein
MMDGLDREHSPESRPVSLGRLYTASPLALEEGV